MKMKPADLADWLERLPKTTNLVYWSGEELAAFSKAAAIIRSTIPQPIEDAPRDGRYILLRYPAIGTWGVFKSDGGEAWQSPYAFEEFYDDDFDAWLPLPEVEFRGREIRP